MSDLIRIDPSAARLLVAHLGHAADQLRHDRAAVHRLLDEAGATLGRDVTRPVATLAGASERLDGLAGDLQRRVVAVEATAADISRIDALTADIANWGRHDPRRLELVQERADLIADLVGGDARLTAEIAMAIRQGADAASALTAVAAARNAEERAVALADHDDIGLAEARAMVAAVDAQLAELAAAGVQGHDAVVVLAVVQNFGIPMSAIIERTELHDVGGADAAGALLAAEALGLQADEYDALQGLREHFAALDNATGGRRDERVGRADLEFVVEHPWRFTTGQVDAARALLDEPSLRHRLDTADDNDDILGPATFGRRSAGDGVIAMSDLEAFMYKAQINHVLGDYADRIDVADDPGGRVDGVIARADLERFIADNDDLPPAVVSATEAMIAGGWFDESWWQEHKDELAMGAALVVGGALVVLTGGGAGLVVVAGAGALAAGGTTVAINLATGDDPLDDAAGNAVSGLFVAAGVHGLLNGASAYAFARTPAARSAAVAGMLAGSSEVVAYGGIDLLLPEDYEDDARAIAAELSGPAAAVDAFAPGTDFDLVDAANLARSMVPIGDD